MRSKKTILLTFLIICAMVIACSDDEGISVGSNPKFELLESQVSSLPGETFTFEGIVSDEAGIKSIHLEYGSWSLDKTIYKNEAPKKYNLSYAFKVPEDAEVGSEHSIPVTVANIGGKTAVENVVVTLNQDIEAPVIQLLEPVDGVTMLLTDDTSLSIDIVVNDEDLAEFSIESDLLTEEITISGQEYTYKNNVAIDAAGVYGFEVKVTDASGNLETIGFTVNVRESLEFDTMYITDVTDDSMLVTDLFGVPYSTEASAVVEEDGFVFTAIYYAKVQNAEVRFIPQKTSFEPYAFGASPDQEGRLLVGENKSVNPITLPEVGYYKVTMDLRDMSYSVNPHTPEGATVYEQVYILGRGITVGDSDVCTNNTDGSTMCWHFKSGKPFVKDANNPNLWTLDITVVDQPDDEGVNGMIINANAAGWAPFWRFDDAVNATTPVFGGGAGYEFPSSSLGNDYKVEFDTYLNRFSLVLD